MRPFRSFLFLLLALVCFTGLSYFLPQCSDLPDINTFFPEELTSFLADTGEASISGPEMISDYSPTGELKGAEKLQDSLTPVADTLYAISGIEPVHKDSLPADPLESFLYPLNKKDEQVRILYYGDSQIEGDRITSYLRYSLRQGRNGTGPGLFQPLMPVMYTESVYIRSSSNWKRYNYISYRNGEISHKDLGPYLSICRFMDEGMVSQSDTKAWVRIVPSRFADSTVARYDWLRIFYGNSPEPVRIVVKGDNLLLYTDTLQAGMGVNEFTCPLFNKKNIIIEFSGKSSPDFYGMSIESKTGIIVDNIPVRGSAGLEFTMIEDDNLRQVYGIIKPDYIILQYGLNIVKNVRSEYNYYQRGLSRQLALLKDISPGSQLLVIGVSDMARSEGDSLKSYSNIPMIVKAQRGAAKESGALFWNTWEKMGGYYSIVRWIENNPPLAQKDYIHFTRVGAGRLAGMIYADLFEYESKNAEPKIFKEEDSVSQAAVPQPASFNGQPEVPVRTEPEISVLSMIFSYNPGNPLIFTSPAFWLFFLFVLAGYSLFYRRMFIRNFYLFLISFFFYYKTGGLFLFLLILVTLIDYFCGILIHRSATRTMRRTYVLLSIVSNLGILAYFKYSGFIIDTINDLFGTSYVVRDIIGSLSNNLLGTSFDVSSIILPVGISFFTFQSLSYTFDVYRRKCKPVRNVLDFGFYVSFFPQLVAGPIVRASEFIPQLHSEFNLSKREFSHALFLIIKGLVKKIIISDYIAVNFVDRVFDMPTLYSGLENLIAVYGYGLQIYCDFSGYTDIAIGLGLILGFRLPVNFNSPYKASSVSDFWKRWHISLSRWLKDYLYIPLGGNRKGKVRSLVNVMATMLLGGLWHGANIRFIIWGGLHGLALVVNRIWNHIFRKSPAVTKFTKFVSVFLTFNFVILCWIFFRAQDMHGVSLMLRQIFLNFQPSSYINFLPVYGNVFALILAGYLLHFLPEKVKEAYRGVFIKIPLAAQMVVVIITAFLLFSMRSTDLIPFIYFRF